MINGKSRNICESIIHGIYTIAILHTNTVHSFISYVRTRFLAHRIKINNTSTLQMQYNIIERTRPHNHIELKRNSTALHAFYFIHTKQTNKFPFLDEYFADTANSLFLKFEIFLWCPAWTELCMRGNTTANNISKSDRQSEKSQ